MTVAAAQDRESSSHVLLLYRSETHRQERVVSWVEQGLARGEKVLYSTVPGDPLLAALDVGSAAPGLRPGQLTVVPSEDIFPGGKQADLVQRALDEGYPAVRLAASADAGLSDTRLDDYQALDQLTDELCTRLPFSALCQLDGGAVSAPTLTTLIDGHSGVVEDAQMQVSRRGRQVVLSGEVDFSSERVLVQALRRACRLDLEGATGRAPGPATIIDLSGLTFADVAGCRALAVGTEELRRAGGTVSLVGVSGHLRKVLSLLGTDQLPGFDVL